MRRLLILAASVLLVMVGLRLVRKLARAFGPRLMEPMMERVMPNMMDSCFKRMPMERRRFMLAHCRGMLDRVEAKYASGEAEPAREGVLVA